MYQLLEQLTDTFYLKNIQRIITDRLRDFEPLKILWRTVNSTIKYKMARAWERSGCFWAPCLFCSVYYSPLPYVFKNETLYLMQKFERIATHMLHNRKKKDIWNWFQLELSVNSWNPIAHEDITKQDENTGWLEDCEAR